MSIVVNFLIIWVILIGTAFANTSSSRKIESSSAKHFALVGGWSLVFFTSYEKSKVEQVIRLVDSQHIKKIKITYPSSKTALALQLKNAIAENTSLKPVLEQFEAKNTAITRYNHDMVVVALYYGQ